jgi:hypothetical protein
MDHHDASELAQRLGRQAEGVCKHYLFRGKREGRYWLVGDVRNNAGRSMFVRLTGAVSGKGVAGRWTDAATGEHGDLLDVIRESCGIATFREVTDEARWFLSLPRLEPVSSFRSRPEEVAASSEAAWRLFAMSQPIAGTVVETHLRNRAITALHETAALRFHPCCYYRPEALGRTETWPAMIASVTDLGGVLTGVHRTWLLPDGTDKAPVKTPRRAMGNLLGHGVRFGVAQDILAAGEGIETVLSARSGLPHMPMLAALSAAHLAAFQFPATLRRLYIVSDQDPAGNGARDGLIERARGVGIAAVVLSPALGDFNEDLRQRGIEAMRVSLRGQVLPEDFDRCCVK